MMLMAGDSSGFWTNGDFSASDGCFDDEHDSNLWMDLDALMDIIGEDNPAQKNVEDPLAKNLSQGNFTSEAGNQRSFRHQSGFQASEKEHLLGAELTNPETCCPSFILEASDAQLGDLFDFNVKRGAVAEIGHSIPTCFPSFRDWFQPISGSHSGERVSIYEAGKPNCSTISGLCKRNSDHDLSRPLEIAFTNTNMSPHKVISTESTICHMPEVMNGFQNHNSVTQCCPSVEDTSFADSLWYHKPKSYDFKLFPSHGEGMVTNTKNGIVELCAESASSSSRMIWGNHEGNNGMFELRMNDHYDVKDLELRHKGNDFVSLACGNLSCNADNRLVSNKTSVQPFSCTLSSLSSRSQATCLKDEQDDELLASRRLMTPSVEVIDEAVGRKVFCNADVKLGLYDDSKPSFPVSSPSISSQNYVVHPEDEKEDIVFRSKRARYCQDAVAKNSPANCGLLKEQILHSDLTSSIKQLACIKDEEDEREGMLFQSTSMVSQLAGVGSESIHSNSSDSQSHVDNDPDICILEDISQPARSNHSLVVGKTIVSSQLADPLRFPGVGGSRLRTNDERLVFRVALQDLSQPKSEAIPPDGVLAVPLLRHQRIALSWMVQKETASLYCSGGILADDQGLGKTVSTIALILKERPPSFRACQQDVKQGELETLTLDDDDDEEEVHRLDGEKQDRDYSPEMSNRSSVKSRNSSWKGKGRPSAGTLVVCPTSVLRQWAEELHNKVTSKANLSVLVYHGSNRTKDPLELAKYDVVLTTYAIVSMEVPKQPLVDRDDDEKGKLEGDDGAPLGRKYSSNFSKKNSKQKRGVDSALFETVARPLAKVGWFRVVLDEAQSIKNHRTQVARACWGLRAKRRWCLSGTPIQNAIDDLYSYFRFLRYDPYAVYKSFCSTIKVPVTRNPAKGYRKLQAVLKTIMLRRTKGTLLDGEPIINLPPKVVELKKVDFTEEERDFYTRLEADSRAQFKEYAAAGTVKQNYVNILLMLLRLRQACDHPLLVNTCNSNSLWRSSIETAKKLPHEKLLCLLNCLEASLAICGICNDPPEDAVVSVCGHVFCNQCISEHLTGDDNECPATNCKVRLNVSSIFSKATINSSISQQSSPNGFQDCSGSEIVDAASIENGPYDSSKIKAALQVLKSLGKSQHCATKNSLLPNSVSGNGSSCPTSCDHHVADSLNGGPDKSNGVFGGSLKDSVKVVGEKAIVFSQWTRMLDLLEGCLKSSSIQYRRLDGTMSVIARDKAVKDFNTLPEVSVMIMSLKAASLGLNMVAACHVLLLDLWWNPTTEDQAIDRAHRIGQTRPVTVLRLTVKDTVEDRILALQQKKREMVASAFGEDESGSRQTRLTVEDLQYLFMG